MPPRPARRTAASRTAAPYTAALLVCLTALAAGPAARPARAQVAGASAAADTARFEAEVRAFEEADRRAPPPAGGVLFVGSSSVRLWCTLDRDFPGLAVVNRGFGGSTMREVTRYAERVVLPPRPRTVVVYAGDNDLAEGAAPAEVRDAYRRLAALVHARLPGTRIVVLAVKPSPAREHLLGRVRATNALLRAEARADPLAAYVDVFTPMLGPGGRPRPGLFGGDGLHMNSAGYALWRAALAPALAPAAAGRAATR